MRDITLGDTFQFMFSTRAFATGIPTTLASGALSVKESGNDTVITAGVSIDIDTGSGTIVGLHEGAVVATGANGYEAGKSYVVYISTGTVDSVSVVGEVVHEFTIALSAAAVVIGAAGVGLTEAGGDGDHLSAIPIVPANVTQISGDAPAADNLELQYDGGGLAGDNFPSTQSQLAGIANVGAAVHTIADSYTLTSGTQSSGTVSSTEALDGTNHEHTDDAGVMDLYYEFLIGAGVPTSVTITGYLNGNNDSLEVYGFDWVASAWVQIGTLVGKNASTNEVDSYEMFVNMVGSGANEGIVRVRFTDGAFTLTTATLAIDQIFLSFSQGAEGYENGAIWIDTTLSNTNTVVGVDGTARNPVSTIAAANTLAASTNLNRFEIAPGSSITLGASQDNQSFRGDNWTLALGGRSIAGTSIFEATVSGVSVGVLGALRECFLGACTFAGGDFIDCALVDTITLSGASEYHFFNCNHAELGAPATIDFGAAVGATEVHIHNFHGNLIILNMKAGDILHFTSADGTLTLDSTCVAGTINLAGTFGFTDSSSGTTVNDNGQVYERLPTALVGGRMSSDVGSISGDATAADRLEALMDGLLVAQVNDGSASTTAFVIDGFTSVRNDQFKGRLCTLINDGGGSPTYEQTAITGYAHATQILTVDALTAAPANDVFMIIH